MGYVLQDISLQWHCGKLALCIVWTLGYFVNQNLMVLTLNLLCQKLTVIAVLLFLNKIQLTEQEMAVLREHVPDPLHDDENSGVDLASRKIWPTYNFSGLYSYNLL